MRQTDQRKPDIGSQSRTVQANPEGSTDVYFGPTAPAGKASNRIQIDPGKGFFTILRLYNPVPPFFGKTWRPSEIEPFGPWSIGHHASPGTGATGPREGTRRG
jgi:hypothetical protein